MTREQGFSYLALLIFLAILSVAASATIQAGSFAQRRAAEQELLAIGSEYRQALISYAKLTPAGQLPYPQSLDDLLRDPRVPGVVRHLRQVYPDPLTGKSEWGLLRGPEDRIIGIHSLSEAAPIKIGEFPAEYAAFATAASYRAWIFKLPVTTTPLSKGATLRSAR